MASRLDRIARAARGERIRTEVVLKQHLTICLSCKRWSKGIPGWTTCDLGEQLTEYIELMHRQEALLAGPDDGWIQEGLF